MSDPIEDARNYLRQALGALMEVQHNRAARYFIGSDNSGHKYAVSVLRRKEWDDWCDIQEGDERSWKVPDYADRIEGNFTFTDPQGE
mgnify:FL=1